MAWRVSCLLYTATPSSKPPYHAANKTLNLRIQTSDNESIGAWFILSDSYYHSLQTIPASVSEHITEAVQRHPTILFLHGNAATRAFSARIQHYATFTSRLSANVLVIDYRGFADSTGQPSQNGLVLDARAAWDWLVAHGTKSENIIVIGHSLGTGVASQFAAQFGHEGIRPRGIVLLAVRPQDLSNFSWTVIDKFDWPAILEHSNTS